MDDPIAFSASLRVLASGSAGNCSVLVVEHARQRHVALIDAGISPRRTRQLLDEGGLTLLDIDTVLVTHLDTDHWYASWADAMPETTVVRMHHRHLGRAARQGALPPRTHPFDGPFDLCPGVRVDPILLAHDNLGVASFRFQFGEGGPTLGFATNVGRVTDHLTGHLRAVDVLAIESNYCPRLQVASDRPWFLKQRIMGGSGHLSNQQAAQAVAMIAPRHHVVFLHLSRQCNRPELVAGLHAGAPYSHTIAEQERPTPWIPISGAARGAAGPIAAGSGRAPRAKRSMAADPPTLLGGWPMQPAPSR